MTHSSPNDVRPDDLSPLPDGVRDAALRQAEEGSSALGSIALLVLVCGALYLPGVWSLPLADPEEARCALVAKGMMDSGRWLAPFLDGEPYYDKPAPYFWLVAGVWKLTGSMELSGRLLSAVAALGAVLIAFAVGRRVGGRQAGLIAALVLATAMEFLLLARWFRMDMPFAALIWAATWWFWRYERPGQETSIRRWIGFYGLCAAATLIKGPAGLALPVAVVAAYFILSRQRRRIGQMFSFWGIILYLLIAMPWYVAVSFNMPQYAREFFLQQNLVRFAGKTLGNHSWPGILYVAILVGGLMPWGLYLPGAVARAADWGSAGSALGRFLRGLAPARRERRLLGHVSCGLSGLHARLASAPGERLFLWLAALVPLTLFSFSKTKLVTYILPVFPPMAVVLALPLADWIARRDNKRLYVHGARAFMIVVAVLALGLGVLELAVKNVLVYKINPDGRLDFNLSSFSIDWSQTNSLSGWFLIPVGGVLACLVAMGLCLLRQRRMAFFGWAVASAAVIFLYLGVYGERGAYEKWMSRGPMGSQARSIMAAQGLGPKDVRICFYSQAHYSFTLYAGATTSVRFHDRCADDLPRLATLMTSPEHRILCLVQGQERLETLRKACGGEMKVWGQHHDLYLVSGWNMAGGASAGQAATQPR